MTTRHRTDRHHLRVGDQTMRQPPRQTTVELAVALQGTGRRSCRSCQGRQALLVVATECSVGVLG